MFHKELSQGGWGRFTLLEQLGNIGSEVGRAARYKGKDEEAFYQAAKRALELFDLTLQDPRWKGRLREIARAREVFCDAVWNCGKLYKSNLKDLEDYFFRFAYTARFRQGA